MTPLEVLLVDDDDAYWFIVQRVCADPSLVSRLRFERVSSGAEGLAFLLSPPAGHRPDLVLLDQRMPKQDGTEVLDAIAGRRELRSLQVALMTSSPDPGLAKIALEKGARFCFAKPTTLEELSESLAIIADLYARVAVLPA